ncbi:MAG: hypothetical protein WCV79_03795 [Candidatus Paceibacterota bacterium]
MSSRPSWVKTLPDSKMVFPDTLPEQVKYVFWRLYTPLHPMFRDMLLQLGIIEHSGRQNFLIGKVAPGQSIRDFVSHLVSLGYGNHFIAWIDQGEVAGLRYVRDFRHQYHIRVFEDGEIRGHFEYTPECYPILHMKAVNQVDCRTEFMKVIGDRIVPIK